MSSHDWIYGWKEKHRIPGDIGYFVDRCKRCGIGRRLGMTVSYILASQLQTFLTTYKPVDFYEYLPCENRDV